MPGDLDETDDDSDDDGPELPDVPAVPEDIDETHAPQDLQIAPQELTNGAGRRRSNWSEGGSFQPQKNYSTSYKTSKVGTEHL